MSILKLQTGQGPHSGAQSLALGGKILKLPGQLVFIKLGGSGEAYLCGVQMGHCGEVWGGHRGRQGREGGAGAGAGGEPP